MIRRLLADRGPELALFDRLATGEADYCILLLEAGGGLGKSTLLREFERRCPSGVTGVAVDFKGELGLADAFSLLGRGLGAERLRRFNEQVAQLLQPEQVVIGRNVLIGKPQIQAALSAPDEETRQFRRAALTDAFFDDLTALEGRVVFIFDTLDDAAPEAREWLLGVFLGHVRHCANVAVVVAGRPPLEERSTWAARCQFVRLEGITAPEDWRDGLLALDPALAVAVSIEWIRAYCLRYDGHPFEIAISLEKVIRAVQRGGGR
jgi:hypothetical protein